MDAACPLLFPENVASGMEGGGDGASEAGTYVKLAMASDEKNGLKSMVENLYKSGNGIDGPEEREEIYEEKFILTISKVRALPSFCHRSMQLPMFASRVPKRQDVLVVSTLSDCRFIAWRLTQWMVND